MDDKKYKHIGYRMIFVYNDCGELVGSAGELTAKPKPYTDIDYIKSEKTLQWIDIEQVNFNIDKKTNRPDLLNAETQRLKRIYFGNIATFESVGYNFEYFCSQETIDKLNFEDLVVVSRKTGIDEDFPTIYPIPTRKSKNKLVPLDNIEVLSQEDLDKVKSIGLHNSKGLNYMLDGAKKLCEENGDFVKNIIS